MSVKVCCLCFCHATQVQNQLRLVATADSNLSLCLVYEKLNFTKTNIQVMAVCER